MVNLQIIRSSEFQELPVAEQYFSLAHGFLEGSRVLCDAMLKDIYPPKFSNTRIILHLCRQAIELFLKGAICSVTSKLEAGHNLDKLVKNYERILPEPQFRFEVPFGVETSGTKEDSDKYIKRFHKTLDQRYRYPADNNGTMFSEHDSFIPLMYISKLQKLSEEFSRIEFLIKNSET